MNMRCSNLLLGFALLFTVDSLKAQISVWKKPDTCWYFYSSHITKLPPLRSDMPYSILASWNALDSLCKNAGNADLDYRLTTMTKDSIRMGLKYFYQLSDYDPLLLSQYTFELADQRRHWKQKPTSILNALLNYYSFRFGEVGDVIRLMFKADHIMHVYVANQDMHTVFYSESPPVGGWKDNFCAGLVPLDIIKGQIPYSTCDTSRTNGMEPRIKTGRHCIGVEWTRASLRTAQTHGDTLRLLQFGGDYLKVGSEYIAFIYYHLERNLRDYYVWYVNGFVPVAFVSNPMIEKKELYLPVTEGIVRDEYNIFGYGTQVPVDVFKRNLRSMINSFIGNEEYR